MVLLIHREECLSGKVIDRIADDADTTDLNRLNTIAKPLVTEAWLLKGYDVFLLLLNYAKPKQWLFPNWEMEKRNNN